MTAGLRPCLAGLALALLATAPLGAAERVLIDQVKIVVNEKMLTQREFETTRRFKELDYRQRYKGEKLAGKMKTLRRDLLDELVESLLLEARAEQLGIQATDAEIDERVSAIVKRDPRVTSAYTDQALRGFVVKDLLKKRVLQREVNSRIYVDLKDVRELCNTAANEGREVDIGHILIRGDPAAARGKLRILRKQLVEGADFEALATAHSEDPQVANNKGRLGFIGRGQFFQPFEDAAFSLQPGELSRPIKTKFGMHLIKVFAVRRKGQIDCKQMDDRTRRRFRDQVWDRLRGERLKTFLAGLRDKAQIIVMDGK